MTAKITTTVYKWDNGKVVEVDTRKNSNANAVSDEKRRQEYEKSRGNSVNHKRNQ
jgi:hypothetical protein